MGSSRIRQRALRTAVPLVGAVVLLSFPAASQDAPSVPEYQVKAAFLYNFAKFVEWPAETHPSPDSPLRVGVLGKDPFEEALERTFKGRTAQGRGFTITRSDDPKNLLTCHIVFISITDRERLAAHLKPFEGRPVLTVGEMPGFARAGGHVNFYLQEKQVRFEINPTAAGRAGLRISSKLLQLARIVREERP